MFISTVQQSASATCPHTPLPSDSSFSPCRVSRERSELHRGFSSVTYFIHGIHSVCGAIPISPFLPPPLFPLGIHVFVLYICVSLFALQIRSSVHFAPCINIQCLVLSFWLTSLCTTISGSMHCLCKWPTFTPRLWLSGIALLGVFLMSLCLRR